MDANNQQIPTGMDANNQQMHKIFKKLDDSFCQHVLYIFCEIALEWMPIINIGSGNGLVQDIIWANVHPDLWHHMVWLGHNELNIGQRKSSNWLLKRAKFKKKIYCLTKNYNTNYL